MQLSEFKCAAAWCWAVWDTSAVEHKRKCKHNKLLQESVSDRVLSIQFRSISNSYSNTNKLTSDSLCSVLQRHKIFIIFADSMLSSNKTWKCQQGLFTRCRKVLLGTDLAYTWTFNAFYSFNCFFLTLLTFNIGPWTDFLHRAHSFKKSQCLEWIRNFEYDGI